MPSSSTSRPVKECIAEVDSKPNMMANRRRLVENNESSADVLKAAEAEIENTCKTLLYNEANTTSSQWFAAKGVRNPESLDYSKNCLITSADSLKAAMGHFGFSYSSNSPQANKAMMDSLQARCKNELNAQDLVTYNKQWSQRYQQQLQREQAKATAQEAADKAAQAVERDKQTVRNFEIKGLGLKTTKQQLLAGGKSVWKCADAKDDPGAEVCTFALAPETCWQEQLTNPLTGEGRVNAYGKPIMLNNCKKTFVESAQIPAEVKKLATVGGIRVETIYIGFFKGEVAEVEYRLEAASPDLEAALVEKYGPPSAKDGPSREWVGRDEVLGVNRERISIRRPSAFSAHEDRVAQRNADVKANAELREKAASALRRKDL